MAHNPMLIASYVLTFLMILFGALGMLLSSLFLLSSNMGDVIGAGFGFVAGAFMLSSATIALAILSNKKPNTES